MLSAINLVSNDQDIDGDSLSITQTTNPSEGVLQPNTSTDRNREILPFRFARSILPSSLTMIISTTAFTTLSIAR